MTLDEIRASTKEMLTPADVAQIIGVDKYSISLQVKADKERGINSFPFPTIRVGTRTKIPRRAFIKALEGVKDSE